MTTDLSGFRDFYSRYVTSYFGVSDASIVEAFRRVPREMFFDPGPWMVIAGRDYVCTETDDPRVLYQDIVVAIDSKLGINNGQPSLHALALARARPTNGERVVQVGAGAGYYTAILAELVTLAGQVRGYEVAPELARLAKANLADRKNVEIVTGSALEHALPATDVLYVCAGLGTIPSGFLNCLNVGARMIAPLMPPAGSGAMLLVERLGQERYRAELFARARFIACAGAQDAEASRTIAEALDRRPWSEVRSLRRHSAPDDSFWCGSTDWWLSTSPA